MTFEAPRAQLVRELGRRRAVIVLGAGASASAQNKGGNRPPTWDALLKDGLRLIRDGADRTIASEYIDRHQYLEAAELFVRRSDGADREDFYRQHFSAPGFLPSALHETIRNIDAKIVITTNYDEIYDQFCRSGQGANGYDVIKYYDSDRFVELLRSEQRIIVKAHGCMSDPSKLILSRSQYQLARTAHPAFFYILDAVFSLSTVLFVGCSMDDPDLQLLLQHAALVTPSTRYHYALLADSVPRPIQDCFREAYHIEPWLYENTADHKNAILALKELDAQISAFRSTGRIAIP